jgi:hypothetical protein
MDARGRGYNGAAPVFPEIPDRSSIGALRPHRRLRFEEHWPEIEVRLRTMPPLQAKKLFDLLQEAPPGRNEAGSCAGCSDGRSAPEPRMHGGGQGDHRAAVRS